MHPARRLATLLSTAYFVGAAAYSITVPVFEGPDEREHFAFVRFLSQHWRIPDLRTEYGSYDWVATHGPLYHLVAAAAVAPFDLSDSSALPLSNPQATSRDMHGVGNRNGFVHTPRETWPYHDDIIRAIHVARLVSATFGAAAVAATVLMAHRFSGSVALVAGLIVGGLPQFLFLGGLVNNDVASAAVSALGLLALLRYWERPGWLPAVSAGFIIGLAVLAKVGGIWLLPLAAVVVLLRRQKLRGKLVLEAVLILVVCLGVCGWWLGMNVARYGDPTGITQHLLLQMGEQVDITVVANFMAMVRGITTSFWAVYGLSNIAAPGWVYIALSTFALAALIGLLVGRALSKEQPLVWLCVAWCVLIGCAALAWAIRSRAWHGRLFFSALTAWAVLVAVGIENWRRQWRFGFALYVLPVGLVVFSVLAPMLLVKPAYAASPAIAAVPEHIKPLCVEYQDSQLGGLELLGVDVPDQLQPGDVLEATFFWRAKGSIPYDLMLFIHLLDHDWRSIGGDNTYHGQGNWPTKLWEAGVIYDDTIRFPIAEDAETPTLAKLTIAIDRYGDAVVATCHGSPIEIPILALVRVVEPQPEVGQIKIAFADTVALTGASWPQIIQAGEVLQLELQWHVQNPPGRPLTRFVHLENKGRLHAQADGIPENSRPPHGELVMCCQILSN